MKNVTITDSYLEVQAGKKNYRLIPVTDEIIRCITSEKEIAEDRYSFIIEEFVRKKEYSPVRFEVEEPGENRIRLKTAKVQAELNLLTGGLIWRHADGSPFSSRNLSSASAATL